MECPAVKGNPVEQYLVHSYIYYELFDQLIADHEFDQLCRWMLEHFDALEHPHKGLVGKEALAAGTAHHLMYKFPEDIKRIAADMMIAAGR